MELEAVGDKSEYDVQITICGKQYSLAEYRLIDFRFSTEECRPTEGVEFNIDL